MQKYQNIKLKTLNGRWTAIDEYSDGEADYIMLECITFSIGMPYLICHVGAEGELTVVAKTDKHITAVMKSINIEEW